MNRRQLKCLARGVASAGVIVMLGACVTSTQVSSGPAAPVHGGNAPNTTTTNEQRVRLRLDLAAAYFSRGQSQTALEEIRLALAADPNSADAHNLAGLIHASVGDVPNADGAFKRALQLSPRDADAMHNYAWFLCQQGRHPEGDAWFMRAIQLPHHGEAPRTLLARGVCQARAGLWANAEHTLARAYERDPTNPATAYNLAEVLLHRGELDRARFYIRRVNQVAEQVTAQSLWLAARIERRLGNQDGARDFGRQLRDRFSQSPEALRFERGQFDD